MIAENKYRFPLLVFNVLFVVLYALLVFNNGYSSDDYWFVYNANLRGIVGGAMYMYQTWTPLPPEVMLLNLLVTVFPEKIALIVYGFFVFLLLVIIAKKYLEHIPIFKTTILSEFDRYQYAVAFSALFFFSCFSTGETWFWLCSSMAYLLPVVAAAWGLYFILLSTLGNIFRYSMIVICWVYVLGSAESVSVTCLLVLMIYLFYKIVKEKGRVLNDRIFKELVVLAVTGFAVMLFIYYSPGVERRKSTLPPMSLVGAIKANIVATGILFLRKLPVVFPFAMIVGLPFVVVGSKLKEITWFTFKNIFYVTIAVLALSSFLLLPMSYILSEIAPDRALTFHVLLFALLFVVLLVFVGYKFQRFNVMRFVWLLPLVSSLFLGWTTYSQYQLLKTYNEKVAERNQLIVLNKEIFDTTIISVPPLPSAGMLHSAELGTDTADFRNSFYKLYFGLKSGVVVIPSAGIK